MPSPRPAALACLPMLVALAAGACTGPRLQVLVSPRALPVESVAAAPPPDGGRAVQGAPDPTRAGPATADPVPAAAAVIAVRRFVQEVVRVEAPRWQPTPVEGRLIEVRADSLWVRAEAGAPPVGLPRGCVTALDVWVPGSPVESAARASFFGTLVGGAVGLFVNPNPTGWQVNSAAYAIPATVAGAVIGTAIGWSRPGGRWFAAGVPAEEGAPPCQPKPVAKPKAKAPAKK